jgi:hypothetical protein
MVRFSSSSMRAIALSSKGYGCCPMRQQSSRLCPGGSNHNSGTSERIVNLFSFSNGNANHSCLGEQTQLYLREHDSNRFVWILPVCGLEPISEVGIHTDAQSLSVSSTAVGELPEFVAFELSSIVGRAYSLDRRRNVGRVPQRLAFR